MVYAIESMGFDESKVPLIKQDPPSTFYSWTEFILQSWQGAKSYLSSLKKYLFHPWQQPPPRTDLQKFIDIEWSIDANHPGERILKYKNGNIYKGQVVGNLPNGQGVLIYKNGNIYKGQFLDNTPHGQGIFIWKNRTIYKGQFVFGRAEGEGTVITNKKNIYRGQFVDWQFQGQGIFIDANGNLLYKGQFHNSKKQNPGIHYQFQRNAVFIEDSRMNKREGKRIKLLKKSNPNKLGFTGYKENYSNNPSQRDLTLIGPKEIQKVTVQNGRITNLNHFHIGSFLFFSLLFGIDLENEAGLALGYPNRILSDYLQTYFQGIQDALKFINSLVEANYLDLLPNKQKTENVLIKLQKKESCLLRYGIQGHAMLLNLVPSKNGDFIDVEIFNSGLGLSKYHIFDPNKKKYQTMKTIRIPLSGLTPHKLQQIIGYKKFENIEEAYQIFLDIPGAQCIESKNPIYQKGQISGNCLIECVFAYLRNKLPYPIYKKMRKDLFLACLNARIKQERDSLDSCLKEPRVLHKIRSLGLAPYGKNRSRPHSARPA